MTGLTKPNWQEAQRFAGLIARKPNPIVCIQVFDDKAKDDFLGEHRHGHLSDKTMQKWIIVKAKSGCGIYFTINETDGLGRSRAHMKKARALAVDLDKKPLPKRFPLSPDIITQSSPGRHWLFWIIEPTDDLNAWSDCQARLAAYYGGDPKIIDPPRVCRLPGFDHQKAEPFRSRIIDANEFEIHTLQEVADAHQCDYNAPAPRSDEGRSDEPEGGWDSDDDLQRARAYLEAVEPPTEGDRNNQAYRVACALNDFGISPEASFDLMCELWNPRLDGPLPDHEIRHVIKSAGRYKHSSAGSKSAVSAADEFADEADFEGDEAKPAKKKKNGLVTVDAVDVEPENIDFLWKDRLALGMHTVLAGIGGRAKSQIMYNIMARITNGDQWPDGSGRAIKGRCIILSAEEGLKDMIVPRLIAAGADLSRITIIRAAVEEGKQRKFSLQADLQKLKATCRDFGDVKLIGFDPVSSYMGGDLDTHRNTAVRHVLDPITQLAEDLRCAILSVTHFNKGSSPQAINRVMESAAFVNAPRASFGVFDDPEDPDTRLLLMLKTNMGKVPPGLRYHVETASGGIDKRTNDPISAPCIVWDGTTEQTADEIVQAQSERGKPRLEEALEFLRTKLAAGPVPVAEVKAHADAEQISDMTLTRARRDLGVRAIARKGTMPAIWEYALPFDISDDVEPEFG